jgi:predicted PolB exonuclease-like 3'-5' exonuclease
MMAWAGYKNTIGLDRLCRALGIPSPKADGMDGSQVFDLWQADNHDAIRIYNAADVAAVRACWWRLNFEGVAA